MLMELWMEEEENMRKAEEFKMRRSVVLFSGSAAATSGANAVARFDTPAPFRRRCCRCRWLWATLQDQELHARRPLDRNSSQGLVMLAAATR